MAQTEQQLASFLTEPPTVFLSMTQGEIVTLGVIAGSLGLLTALLVGLATQSLFLGALMGAAMMVAITLIGARKLKRLRATRPRGYLRDQWLVWQQRISHCHHPHRLITGSIRYGKGRQLTNRAQDVMP